MFDLERAIQHWKQSFSPDSSISPDALVEMESHLREQVAELSGKALSEQEAFMIGVHRLGVASELEAEFAKNQPLAAWRKRLFWMLGGYLTVTICGAIVSGFVAITGLALALAGLGGTTAGVVCVAVQALGWIGLLALGYSALQRHDFRSDHFSLKWAAVAAAVLVVAPIISSGGRIVQARVVDISWFGESAMWLAYGGAAVHFSVLLFCIIAMCKFSQPTLKAVD